MRELWLVAKHEYVKRVRERSFLFAVLGVPLLIVVVMTVSIIVTLGGGDDRPVGYVDEANVLDRDVLPALIADSRRFAEFVAYPDEAAAREALASGDLQAFYLVPEDYLDAQELTLVFDDDSPGEGIRSDFSDFLRASLLERVPADARVVLDEGLDLMVQTRDGSREMSEGNIIGFLLPFAITFFLIFAVASAGGYLLQAVTDEKENRVVEIVTTSISPEQLMGGKALGLMAVSLTQILVWTLALAIGVVVATQVFEGIGPIGIPWVMLGLTVLFFIPTFLLITGIMISIGGIVAEQQQGQQIAGIVNMVFIMPTFFVAVIMAAPNSPFLTIMTLFPTTAFLTILLRWSLASVPVWQLITSWILIVATALVTIWLAARIFRMGMLRYGQRLSLKSVVAGLRNQRVAVEKETAPHA